MCIVSRDDDRFSVVGIAAQRAVGWNGKTGVEGLCRDFWEGHPVISVQSQRRPFIIVSVPHNDIGDDENFVACCCDRCIVVVAIAGKSDDGVASKAHVGSLRIGLCGLKAAKKVAGRKNDGGKGQ